MEEITLAIHTSLDADLNHSHESHSAVEQLQELFLNFAVNSKLSFEDKSAIYNSLVVLVKAEYPFDNILQDKAVQFLKNLEPGFGDETLSDKLVTDLVPSFDGSHSGFVEGILTLLSSRHSTVIAASLSFLHKTTLHSSPSIRRHLVESDLINNILDTVQPHTLPICGNETIIINLFRIIDSFIYLTSPRSLNDLDITDAVDTFKRREMIFQKVLLPSFSRMTPSHFCGLSSDVGNALIAGADEQILGSPPIVQKCNLKSGSEKESQRKEAERKSAEEERMKEAESRRLQRQVEKRVHLERKRELERKKQEEDEERGNAEQRVMWVRGDVGVLKKQNGRDGHILGQKEVERREGDERKKRRREKKKWMGRPTPLVTRILFTPTASSSNPRSSQRVSLSAERLHDTQTHHTQHDAELDDLVTGVEPLLPIDCPQKMERMDRSQRPLLFHSKEFRDLVNLELRKRIDNE
ncbi:hypothetical protein BLNAU_7237 [Blattamonas nauphoetae]|uniref:Uncharacterized protein n=1 Tax=Blattamonas nauphoetae TaxID=2049346 RepID=A0ABQ9Y279_9EUKA|nr:hypothetical protein BLNAU_7237 [Blattamonas nauphoetae]